MGKIPGILTTEEAANILGVDPKSILRVPGIKSVRRQKVGQGWAWHVGDINALAANFVAGTARPARPKPAKVDKRRRFNIPKIQEAHAAATALMLREYKRAIPGATAEDVKSVQDLFLDHFNYLTQALKEGSE